MREQEAGDRIAFAILPWLLLALTVILGGVAIVFLLGNQSGPGSEPIPNLYGDMVYLFSAVVGATVGALIVARRRRNPIGWFLLGVPLFQVAEDVFTGYSTYALVTQPGALSGAILFAWLAQWMWTPVFAALLLAILLYPTGQLLSRRWRVVAWAGVVTDVVLLLGLALASELEVGNGNPPATLPNPIGLLDAKNLVKPMLIPGAFTFMLALLFAALASLIIRFRRARGDERQQIKWFTYAVALALVTEAVASAVLGEWAQVVQNIAFLMLPVSVGVAILKYRLYDIDLLINRTLVYLPLTGVLAGIFAATITISQKLFLAITGQTSEAATVLTTLVVVAAFTPIKDRLQTVVDKRFKEAPDPAKKLKSLEDQIRSRMFTLEPKPALRRLLEQAVWAFEAKGGAANFYPPASKPNYTFGDWTGEAKLSAVLESNGTRFGSISLGVRRNGTDYSGTDRQVLSHICSVVARAIEQDDKVDGYGQESERS